MDTVQRRVLLASGILAAGVCAVVLVRTVLSGRRGASPSHKGQDTALLSHFHSKEDEIAAHLAEALTLRTVSFENEDGTPCTLLPESSSKGIQAPAGGCSCCLSTASSSTKGGVDARATPTPAALDDCRKAFLDFHVLLEKRYPLMHATLERHVVNTYSLLYVWRGSSPQAPGMALCAHMDVVPAADAAEWQYPPFSGTIAGGYVHGRGAIDDKHSLITICEAVEYLLGTGFTPQRPVALCFGHDEEIGGMDGAAHIAALLPTLLPVAPGDKPLTFLLDEGLFLLEGLMPGLTERAAVVCTVEKGHVNVEVKCSAPAGHSSVPPPSSTIGSLGKALAALESTPYPPHLWPAMNFFTALLPAMPFLPRLLFSNEWLFAPILRGILLAQPTTAAMLRTTTAVTIVNGGVKSNVLPPTATAIVNRRIHPRDTVASVMARDARVIAGVGVKAELRAMEPLEPSPTSSSLPTALGWSTIANAVQTVFSPPPLVAPGLMMGNTDTRWYWGVAQDIYRHCPTELTLEGTKMFHGKDEKVKIDNLARLCAFYVKVIQGGATL